MHRFECRFDVDYQIPCLYLPAEPLLFPRRSLSTVSLGVQAPTPKTDVYFPESREKHLFIWGALGGANLTFYAFFWFITFIYDEECVIPRSRTIILTHRVISPPTGRPAEATDSPGLPPGPSPTEALASPATPPRLPSLHGHPGRRHGGAGRAARRCGSARTSNPTNSPQTTPDYYLTTS